PRKLKPRCHTFQMHGGHWASANNRRLAVIVRVRLAALQIDDDILDRLRAANEKVAGGRLFERFRSIDNCSGNQSALTVVTNAGSAGPKGGDVARFSQFQNALIF